MSAYPHAVLYTMDLEPITVLKMKPMYWDLLRRDGRMLLSVPEPIRMRPDAVFPFEYVIRSVLIRAERLRYRDKESLMLFTGDEESAMLLQAGFLPGQTRELNDCRAEAFARGFLVAMLGE